MVQWTGLRHTLQTLRQRPRIHSKGILWTVANKQTLKRAWAAVPGELRAGSSLLKARLTLLKVCVSFGYLPYVATALTLSSWFVISKLSSYEGTSQGGQGISSEPPGIRLIRNRPIGSVRSGSAKLEDPQHNPS